MKKNKFILATILFVSSPAFCMDNSAPDTAYFVAQEIVKKAALLEKQLFFLQQYNAAQQAKSLMLAYARTNSLPSGMLSPVPVQLGQPPIVYAPIFHIGTLVINQQAQPEQNNMTLEQLAQAALLAHNVEIKSSLEDVQPESAPKPKMKFGKRKAEPKEKKNEKRVKAVNILGAEVYAKVRPSLTCPSCKQKLSCTTAYDGHIKKHTGETPWRCTVENCAYGSSLKANCIRHALNRHGQEIEPKYEEGYVYADRTPKGLK